VSDSQGPAHRSLEELLAAAHTASGLDRIGFRDQIAAHGTAAVMALVTWLDEPGYGAFAVRTIERAGRVDSNARRAAVAVLESGAPHIRDLAVQRDALETLARLKTAWRPATTVQTTRGGATIAGRPIDDAEYSPALSQAERRLIDVLARDLPAGWTIFVRPHLDGDRPALALLHRECGGMLWDIRDDDLSGIHGTPKAYARADGDPYLDPIERINQLRRRLYSDYLPDWAEAIDNESSRFGAIRVGVYFPQARNEDLQRLGMFGRHEVAIGRGLDGRRIEDIVPNAFRQVDFDENWHAVLFNRFSEYHPPTFGGITPTKRQAELIADPIGDGWRGIEGVAGAGKSTVLARRANRLAYDGHRVLLVTYNLTLANYCRGLVEDAPERFQRSNLVVQHFHGLCHVLLRRLGVPAPLHPNAHQDDAGPTRDIKPASDEEQDHYDRVWPERTVAALVGHHPPDDLVFDSILVDEAQDFGSSFFDVLQHLLAPGGEVVLAFDRAQRLYARDDGISNRMDMRRIKKLNGTRRLRQRHADIASEMGASRRLPTERIVLDDGIEPLFSDEDAKWAQVRDTPTALATTADVLTRWRERDGYRPDGTVVLVPSNSVGQAVVSLLADVDVATNHIFALDASDRRGRRSKQSFVPNDQRVKVSTIHSYKGWEAEDVIVLEPPFSGEERLAAAAYVALTRAKSRLMVIASADPYGIRRHFDEFLAEPDKLLLKRARRLLGADITGVRGADGRGTDLPPPEEWEYQ
jgi:hypothetical protein